MPPQRDNVQAAKLSGAQGIPQSTPPFLGGLGGSQSPEPSFSLVPSTARSLFDGSKRECGVGTVGSGNCHALTGRGYKNIRPKSYIWDALFTHLSYHRTRLLRPGPA